MIKYVSHEVLSLLLIKLNLNTLLMKQGTDEFTSDLEELIGNGSLAFNTMDFDDLLTHIEWNYSSEEQFLNIEEFKQIHDIEFRKSLPKPLEEYKTIYDLEQIIFN